MGPYFGSRSEWQLKSLKVITHLHTISIYPSKINPLLFILSKSMFHTVKWPDQWSFWPLIFSELALLCWIFHKVWILKTWSKSDEKKKFPYHGTLKSCLIRPLSSSKWRHVEYWTLAYSWTFSFRNSNEKNKHQNQIKNIFSILYEIEFSF